MDGLLTSAKRKFKGLLSDAENLSIGLGHGISNQLEGMYQLGAHPVQSAKAMYQAGKAVYEDPSLVGGLLKDAYQTATSGPLGLGLIAGENMSLRPRTPRGLLELKTYHGSPHRINNVTPDAPYGKFDLSKVGTGEGAQAYGHGIYLAENPRVAKEYAEKLSVNASWPMSGYNSVEKANPDLLREITAAVGDDPSRINRAVIKPSEFREISPDLKKRINAFKKDYRGNFYTVDLPDEHIAKMLDWDAPLSEQPEIMRLLEEAGHSIDPTDTGEMFYNGRGGGKWMSDALKEIGIPGIKYFDGGSRAAGEGTRNFVIFDPEVAKILSRE
jgi:hypothetical protein